MPNNLVLVSHAELAQGARSALRLILGDVCPVTCVGVTEAETIETVAAMIEEAICSVDPDEPTVVVTDIPGGSPTQGALREMGLHPNVHFVTGMSLGLLLEIALLPLEAAPEARDANLELLREAVQTARTNAGLLADLVTDLAPESASPDSGDL